jgi:hypothetical protein
MSNDPVDTNFSGPSSSFWTAGRWFVALIFILFASIGVYLYVHMDKVRTGYQLTQFTPSHIDQLNRILYNVQGPIVPAPSIKDTSKADSASDRRLDSLREVLIAAQQRQMALQVCDDTCRINKALLYVRTEFDNKLQPDQEEVIKAYIGTFSAQEVGSYLAQLKLKVTSYFWLSGPFMYVEMIFWVIFGVICSNLFALGVLGRTRGFSSFDAREVPYQVAKFFYAPFCVIMLILAYNYVKHKNVLEVHATEGMIVFSFIAGLFSGRMMSFLERFKDALLPENVKAQEVVAASRGEIKQSRTTPAPKVVEKIVEVPVVKETPKKAEQVKPQEEPKTEVEKPMINDLYKQAEKATPEEEKGLHALAESMAFIAEERNEPEPQAAPTIIEPEIIEQAVVMLNLDVSGLYEEEKNEIIDIGFANAVVTMHNVNGKDVVTARKSDDKYTASFVAANVKPGIYIVRCTLTQKLSDDYVINLFGERTAYVTNENRILELFIKKYEAID